MKKTILTLAVVGFTAATLLTNCKSSSEKVEKAEDKLQDAKENVVDAKQELRNTLNDSILQFRKESEEKISANQKSIAEFKARIAKEKKESKDKYDKEISALEQKNTDLKMKLDEFKEDGKDKWQSFKVEFNRDMSELGTALKDFTISNKK